MYQVAIVPSKDQTKVTLQASEEVWAEITAELKSSGWKGIAQVIERELTRGDGQGPLARRVTIKREHAQHVYTVAGISG